MQSKRCILGLLVKAILFILITYTSSFSQNPDSIPFSPPLNYPEVSGPYSVIAADFDGDGDQDLAVPNVGEDFIRIHKNNGDGTFPDSAIRDFVIPDGLSSVFASDLDGDGDQDLAVAKRRSNTVSILKNNGDGTFATEVDYPTTSGPRSVTCCDLDGDGDQDLAVAYDAHGETDRDPNTVSVLKNNGDGTFAPKVDYVNGGSFSKGITCCDLDGDRDQDLVVANFGHCVTMFCFHILNNFSVLRNNGDGTFARPETYEVYTGSRPQSVICSDLDRDGDQDLVVTNGHQTDYNKEMKVSILKNNGDGTFPVDSMRHYEVGGIAHSVFAADLDNDGDRDLAVGRGLYCCATYSPGDNNDTFVTHVAVLRNNGNGNFGPYVWYETPKTPMSVAASDLDTDGDMDLVTVNLHGPSISILKNLIIRGESCSNLSEESFKESNLKETVVAQKATIENVTISGDLNGTLNFSNFEIVSITTGAFEGKGFSKGEWTANLEGSSYQGILEGMVFLKPAERRIFFKGSVSGEISNSVGGIVEGYLTESVNGSGVYDSYQATWRLNRIRADFFVSATIELAGQLVYDNSIEFPSTNLYVLQTICKGTSLGYYVGPLNTVLTHVRIVDSTNAYSGEGFSIISYFSNAGSGEGWTHDKVIAPGQMQLKGMFSSPLLGVASGELDERILPRSLTICIDRIDLGLPPMPRLVVNTWGPKNVSPGQTINHVIEYRNDGAIPAQDVQLIDLLPIEETYISSTGQGNYEAESHRVVWRLSDVPAGSVGYLSSQLFVEFGLAPHTLLEHFISIPKDTIRIAIDSTAEVSYEILEADSTHVRMIANISSQSVNGSINMQASVTEVSGPTDPILQYMEDLDSITVTFEFTTEANSWDNVFTIIKTARDVWDYWVILKDAKELAKARKEMQNLLDCFKQKNYLSDDDYNRFSGANNTSKFAKFAFNFLSYIPIFDYLAQSGRAVLDDLDQSAGRLELDKAIRIYTRTYTESEKDLSSATKDCCADNSFACGSFASEVLTAHDPNIKYSPDEGIINPAEQLNYTVQYENEGEGTAFGVYFTDKLDEDLDDATLQIGPVISIIDGSVIAPPGTYDPLTRTITWFVGEVGPEEGGSTSVNVNVRNRFTPHVTNIFNPVNEIINYATIYFPSVPEVTRTNAIITKVGAFGACSAKPGDSDGNDSVILSDIVYLVNYLFKKGPSPVPLCRGDANADGTILLSDIVYLINYLFKSGSLPLKSGVCCL